MSSCWKENPLMRPAFSQIAQQLKNFLREVKVINGCIWKLSISSFLSLFSKLYLPSSSSFHLFIFASLHPFMNPSVTLSVLLINLLSSTAAIHPSIRTHSHPFPSIYMTLFFVRSFFCLFLSPFSIRFSSYTLFLSLFKFFCD